VRLKAIHQGVSSSALYLEASSESSLAAYFTEFANIMGKGSDELLEKLDAISPGSRDGARAGRSSGSLVPNSNPLEQAINLEDPLDLQMGSHAEAMQSTEFWTSEKAIVILTGDRRIWLEAASSESLTLRPPPGSLMGVDLIRGRFVTEEIRRQQQQQGSPVHR
jgi:hypothetical protein